MYIPIPQCRSESSDENKYSKNQKAWWAVMITVLTALSSSGIAGGVHWFTNSGRSGVSNGQYPAATQFITNDTRSLVADLEGEWRFSKGDDMRWAAVDFDASSWSTVDVPSDWESEGFRDYDGYAWYRKSFRVDSADTDKALYAYVGQVDDVDEVFVNGQRIGGLGRFGANYLSAWDRDRVYRIPDGLIHEGDGNVMAVRVFDEKMGGGIVRGRVGIYASELPQPFVDLSGDWMFRTGDDFGWKEEAADESGFSRIHVPILWEAEGFKDYDGYAWYRKRFGRVAVDGNETMVLVLGKIDDTDEVFLNGERIGKTGALDRTDYETNRDFYILEREYEFPASLLKESNVLAVRVFDGQGGGGIYSGPVGIMTRERLDAYHTQLEESVKWDWQDLTDWMLGRK